MSSLPSFVILFIDASVSFLTGKIAVVMLPLISPHFANSKECFDAWGSLRLDFQGATWVTTRSLSCMLRSVAGSRVERLNAGAMRSKDSVLGSLAAGQQDCGKSCRTETADTEPRDLEVLESKYSMSVAGKLS